MKILQYVWLLVLYLGIPNLHASDDCQGNLVKLRVKTQSGLSKKAQNRMQDLNRAAQFIAGVNSNAVSDQLVHELIQVDIGGKKKEACQIAGGVFLLQSRCDKAGWLAVNDPEKAREASDAERYAYLNATKVREKAIDEEIAKLEKRIRENKKLRQNSRSPYVVIDASPDRLETAAEETKEAIQNGALLIVNATFIHKNSVAVIDFVRRETARSHWQLVSISAKSTLKLENITNIKKTEKDIPLELAYKRWIFEKNGFKTYVPGGKLPGIVLQSVNRDFVKGKKTPYFKFFDMTSFSKERLGLVPQSLKTLEENLKKKLFPEQEIGMQCFSGKPCPFMEFCFSCLPENNVFDIPGIFKTRAFELMSLGIVALTDFRAPDGSWRPEFHKLSALMQKMVEATIENKVIVDTQGLSIQLDLLQDQTVTYLDFEGLMEAIPWYEGQRPYNKSKTQTSMHIERPNGILEQIEFLQGGINPNIDMKTAAKWFFENLPPEGPIVVYFKGYENSMIKELAKFAPSVSKAEVESVLSRVWDMYKVIKDHVYHPNFKGSFSLKRTAPALLGFDMYKGLPVNNGSEAQIAFLKFEELHQKIQKGNATDREKTRYYRLKIEMLKYCEFDTLVMVELRKALVDLALGK